MFFWSNSFKMKSNLLNKDKIISRIVDIEWEMFVRVNNVSGKASCQNGPTTFRIMRSSHFSSWSEDVLRSYLGDLLSAKKCSKPDDRKICKNDGAYFPGRIQKNIQFDSHTKQKNIIAY